MLLLLDGGFLMNHLWRIFRFPLAFETELWCTLAIFHQIDRLIKSVFTHKIRHLNRGRTKLMILINVFVKHYQGESINILIHYHFKSLVPFRGILLALSCQSFCLPFLLWCLDQHIHIELFFLLKHNFSCDDHKLQSSFIWCSHHSTNLFLIF